jgi:oxygen-independent coproporphyrinogen-3 oxidase
MKENSYLKERIEVGCSSPRYTSYPPHPQWNQDIDQKNWFESLKNDADQAPIGLYLHLPFCESLCRFCGCPRIISKSRYPMEAYLDLIQKEWKEYLKILPPHFLFSKIQMGGGTPTYFSPKELEILLQDFQPYFQENSEKFYAFEAHPKSTTWDHLSLLKELGFGRVSFGIQDFDPTVQKAIGRIEPFDEVAHVVEMARRAGYSSINFDLIYGLPEQTHESFQKTLELSVSLSPDRIALFSYAHVPWLHPHQNQMGKIPRGLFKWKLYRQGHEFLQEQGYLSTGFDHYAKASDTLFEAYQSGRIDRNFNGMVDFSPNCQIGLGLFAISHSSLGYVQNHRLLSRYRKSLQGDLKRFFWTHALSEKEKRVRDKLNHILIYGKILKSDLSGDDLEELFRLGICESSESNQLEIAPWAQPFRRLAALYADPLRAVYSQRSFSQII